MNYLRVVERWKKRAYACWMERRGYRVNSARARLLRKKASHFDAMAEALEQYGNSAERLNFGSGWGRQGA
jgi:hypothetical protein